MVLSDNSIRREFQDGEILCSIPQPGGDIQVECLIHTVLGECVDCLKVRYQQIVHGRFGPGVPSPR